MNLITMSYQEQTHNLIKEQRKIWPLLHENSEALKAAKLRTIQFEGYSFKVQCNAQRFSSASAKVDKKSIAERPCFLCKANRPVEQTQVVFQQYYEILCNPYPIFREHYTIAHKAHLSQTIASNFSDFLDLTRMLPDLVTLYNGANCGASAPDHLHFQAGNRGLLPMESEWQLLKMDFGKTILQNSRLELTGINDGMRRFILMESNSKENLEKVFEILHQKIREISQVEEPMLNLLAWYENNKWIVFVFLREKHRPWQYFEEGQKNILLSPGLMEMAGALITPLEKDFEKLTQNDIVDIFNQVSMKPEHFDKLCAILRNQLK